MLRQQSNSNEVYISQLKLQMLKDYIGKTLKVEDFKSLSSPYQLEIVKSEIMKADAVGEIWTILFENRLYDFYHNLIAQFEKQGLIIELRKEDLIFQRKKDMTHALHWLANNSQGIDLLKQFKSNTNIIDSFSIKYGKDEVDLWHHLAKTEEGRKLITKEFFRSRCCHGFPYDFAKDSFEKRSKVDNTCTWDWLALDPTLLGHILKGGSNSPDFNPPTKALFKERQTADGNSIYDKFFRNFHKHDSDYKDHHLELFKYEGLCPGMEDIEPSILMRFWQDFNLNLDYKTIFYLIKKGIYPNQEILLASFIHTKNKWHEYCLWDKIFEEINPSTIQLLNILFTNKVFPSFQKLLVLLDKLSTYKSSDKEFLDLYKLCISFYNTNFSLKENELHLFLTQYKQFFPKDSMVMDLISHQDQEKFYGYLYWLYAFDLFASEIRLNIGKYCLPPLFVEDIEELKKDENRYAFIKFHTINQLKNLDSEESKFLINDINKSQQNVLVKREYWKFLFLNHDKKKGKANSNSQDPIANILIDAGRLAKP